MKTILEYSVKNEKSKTCISVKKRPFLSSKHYQMRNINHAVRACIPTTYSMVGTEERQLL